MPLYEYACDVCGHRFEVIQKYSDAPIATCPTCGGPVTKLLSSPAIQFKGSGWYITDYARAGRTDTGGGSKSESSATGDAKADPKSSETTTAAKPEAKSETKSETRTESKPAPPSSSSSS